MRAVDFPALSIKSLIRTLKVFPTRVGIRIPSCFVSKKAKACASQNSACGTCGLQEMSSTEFIAGSTHYTSNLLILYIIQIVFHKDAFPNVMS
jgi:hypothetical protein